MQQMRTEVPNETPQGQEPDSASTRIP